MNGFACPKLKNRDTEAEIELNTNPFSIGRGLTCNYVLQSKTISRVHCTLEKNGDNSWVLNDTSTNGTFVNGRLVRHVRSAPLKDNDTISLDLSGAHRYVFLTEHSNDDISDEQLCAIADTVLSEMEFLASSPVAVAENEMLGAAGPPPNRTTPDSAAAAANPLHDHMYMAKSSNEVTKKARVGRSPRPILGCGNRGGSDSATRSIHDPSNPSLGTERTGDVPARNVDNVPDGVEDGATNAPSETGSGEGGRRVGERRDVTDPERSEDPEERERDEGSRNEEAAVGSSQCSAGTLRVGEGELCPPQPGPSTDKDEKPSEQTDNYEVMENELQCVICSELFVKALTLNCSHTFCKYCIQMWNKNKSDCPICRQRITSKTATIVLDNVIEKVIENSNEEIKRRRRSVLEERKRQEEAEVRPPSQEERRGAAGSRGGRRGRGRGGRSGRRARGGRPLAAPRINVLDPLSINIGALVNNVIEVSSESEWSSDTESTSPVDTQDDYYRDDWYGGGGNGSYWGGYGYCFRCGSPTHWANNCPNR